MLRICLVEDEEYALKSLRQKIIDLDGPYEIVGTAYNGYDALEVISQQYPDVVITDIRMPDMDGIALIEQISLLHKNIITVIVSGYQEFEYAKAAIQFHAEEYLLKPVVPNELRKCLETCDKKVSTHRNTRHIGNGVAEASQLGGGESLIIYLIFGNAVFHPESLVHPKGFYISSQDIEEKIQNIVQSTSPALCFIGICSNEKIFICQKGHLHQQSLLEKNLERKLKDLAKELEEEYRDSVTISYKMVESVDKLTPQIDLCRAIAVQNALPGISRVVAQTIKNVPLSQNLNIIINDIVLCIKKKQLEALNITILNLFAEWEKHLYTLSTMQNDLIYITNCIKYNIPLSLELDFTVVYYVENMIAISNTYTDLANNYYNFVPELFEEAFDNEELGVSPEQLVENIERYFQENLTGNITLSELCTEMNYSKVYLCRIFKKIKNTTPIDYFIQLKIQRAKSLVQEYPTMPIKDIANSLGFHDVYYFSKVFKKIVGMPHTAVREQVE